MFEKKYSVKTFKYNIVFCNLFKLSECKWVISCSWLQVSAKKKVNDWDTSASSSSSFYLDNTKITESDKSLVRLASALFQ